MGQAEKKIVILPPVIVVTGESHSAFHSTYRQDLSEWSYSIEKDLF